jgi:hypothetical protein
MNRILKGIFVWIALLIAGNASAKLQDSHPASILWNNPAPISERNLYWGSGGANNQPHGPYTFIKEDLDGTSPKFDVCDRNGNMWKVKLGLEAQPEVAASRLLWAIGYLTADYYFIPNMRVRNMPDLKRGRDLVSSDGKIFNARLKRLPDHENKIGVWRWKKNPFRGSREFNGLRIMMALINNWDLKDANTGIYEEKRSGAVEYVYKISDLGTAFGTNHWIHPLKKAKGCLQSYSESKFILKIRPDYVDFAIGGRPSLVNAVNPKFFQYLKMGWIGRRIPREDARWIGQMLSQLSERQIQDAFRAAGYCNCESESFAKIIMNRIIELKKL